MNWAKVKLWGCRCVAHFYFRISFGNVQSAFANTNCAECWNRTADCCILL